MKRLFALIVATFMGVVASQAAPDDWKWGHNEWGVMASYWNTADADDGFGPGLKFSFGIAEGVQLELRGSYFDDLAKGEGDINVDLEVVPLEAGFALQRPVGTHTEFYGGGCIGYYRMDGSVSSPPGVAVNVNPENEFGYYLTTGVDFITNSSTASYGKTAAVLFAELMYRAVNANSVTVDGETLRVKDASLDGIGVNAGIMVRW